MQILNPAPKTFSSSVKDSEMFNGIPLVKATDNDFQRVIDVTIESVFPDHEKAGLETVAMASGEAYRDANFIVNDPDYIRAEAAAQVVRCHLALDGEQVSSEFDLRKLDRSYHHIYFSVIRFLAGGPEARQAFYARPVASMMGWVVLDPKGIAEIIDKCDKRFIMIPV